jgi:CBS-domain-containing membrane protein
MLASTQSLTGLTAGDLMSRDLVSVSPETPMHERVIVVDRYCRLAGIISSTDVLAGIVRACRTEAEA